MDQFAAEQQQKAGAASAAAGAAAAAAVPAAPVRSDTTLEAVSGLVDRIRAEAEATGAVSVPRTLKRLKEEAASRGFKGDAEGLYAYVLAKAVEAEDAERERKETGLGGALRRTINRSPVVRNAASTVELATARPYRDPAIDTGDDSILARKVHGGVKRFDDAMAAAMGKR